jgi:cyclic nucleotide gated channel
VQFKNGESDSVKERTASSMDCRICIILDPKGEFLKRWNVAFVLSCVIAVSLDPLFFYLPVIIEEKKCIGLDKKLWTTAIVLRSINDFIYLMHIILQFRTGFMDEHLLKSGIVPELNTDARKIAQRYWWPYFLFDILVILPIPKERDTSLNCCFDFFFFQ